jgi:hypothetical protein
MAHADDRAPEREDGEAAPIAESSDAAAYLSEFGESAAEPSNVAADFAKVAAGAAQSAVKPEEAPIGHIEPAEAAESAGKHAEEFAESAKEAFEPSESHAEPVERVALAEPAESVESAEQAAPAEPAEQAAPAELVAEVVATIVAQPVDLEPPAHCALGEREEVLPAIATAGGADVEFEKELAQGSDGELDDFHASSRLLDSEGLESSEIGREIAKNVVDSAQNLDKMRLVEKAVSEGDGMDANELVDHAFEFLDSGRLEEAAEYFYAAMGKRPAMELEFKIVIMLCHIYIEYGNSGLSLDILESYRDKYGDVMPVGDLYEMESCIKDIREGNL